MTALGKASDTEALDALRQVLARIPKPQERRVAPVGNRVPLGSRLATVVSLDPTTDREATIVTVRVEEGFDAYVVEGKPWRYSASAGRMVPAGWRP